MLMGFVIVIHSLACIALIFIVLIQSGRGGGLTEGFAGGAESMFGAKTNETMIKVTTGLTVVFLITSLTLAFMSARAEKSLMEGEDLMAELPLSEKTITLDIPTEATAPETKPVAEAQPPVKVEQTPFAADGTRTIETNETYTVKEQPEQE